MAGSTFDRQYGGAVELDICHACQVIWFDGQELLQLNPAATLGLLSSMSGEEPAARPALSASLRCPRCDTPLLETHDMQRATRFTYFRCPAGHGRLLTYYQLLRAKNLVRPLGPEEIDELRRRIRQVNCANCGAPVDVQQNAACAFCRTPIAILDPDQLQKAVAHLKDAAAPKPVDPTLPVALMIERARAERAFADGTGQDGRASLGTVLGCDTRDLLTEGLRALRKLLA